MFTLNDRLDAVLLVFRVVVLDYFYGGRGGARTRVLIEQLGMLLHLQLPTQTAQFAAAGVGGRLAGTQFLKFKLAVAAHVPVDVAYAVQLLQQERNDRAVERDAVSVDERRLVLFRAVRGELRINRAVYCSYKHDQACQRGESCCV